MIIKCRHINYTYPDTNAPVILNLDFEMASPGFDALFGPSGVGKTSLARILTGQTLPDAGRVEASGMALRLYSYNLERLPGWSGVGRHLDKMTPPGKKTILEELIHFCGVASCMDSRFSKLSLGQKNRVNLIRYLLQDFQLLVMDESLANVDERTREKIILKIKEMFPDRFFLYISHNVIEVSKYCRNITVLRDAHKSPQVTVVSGRDHRIGGELSKNALEAAMLEVMNAA